jgi:hypothetical protein
MGEKTLDIFSKCFACAHMICVDSCPGFLDRLDAHDRRLEGDLEVLAADGVPVHVRDSVHRVGHAVVLHEPVALALPGALVADDLP